MNDTTFAILVCALMGLIAGTIGTAFNIPIVIVLGIVFIVSIIISQLILNKKG